MTMAAAAVVFWVCLGLLVYAYAGYPLLARLLAAVLDRRPRCAAHLPSVTILISAYNEAAVIAATIRNKLGLDYPADRLEIVVVSDGSEDGTDAAVSAIAAAQQAAGGAAVRLLRQEPRAGKTAALNVAVPHARGEVLVFSDANSLYAPDALRRLMEPLADPRVGYVTGRMVYRAPDGSLTGEGCSAYMNYENRLRAWETRLGSIVGTDGGLDAVRRELYLPMRPDQLPDFVLPLSVRQRGWRVVYAADARLYEDALAASADEFRMRVRVTLRALHALKDMRALLLPWRSGLYAWQLLSHKVLRYLAPLFQAGALAANLVLAVGGGAGWRLLLVAQLCFYAAAAAGPLLRGRRHARLLSLPYYLCLVNGASSLALIRFLRGRKQVLWTPRT